MAESKKRVCFRGKEMTKFKDLDTNSAGKIMTSLRVPILCSEKIKEIGVL